MDDLDVSMSYDVSDLSPLNGMRLLENLNVQNTSASRLPASLPNLRRLDCIHTPISDLSPLANSPLLTWIDITRTGVKNISPLTKCTKMHSFTGNYQEGLVNISAMKGWTDLVVLSIFQTGVKDLNPIKNCKQLRALDVRSTAIHNFKAVTKHLRLLEDVGRPKESWMGEMTTQSFAMPAEWFDPNYQGPAGTHVHYGNDFYDSFEDDDDEGEWEDEVDF